MRITKKQLQAEVQALQTRLRYSDDRAQYCMIVMQGAVDDVKRVEAENQRLRGLLRKRKITINI